MMGKSIASIALCLLLFVLICAGSAIFILRGIMLNAPQAIAKTDFATLADEAGLIGYIREQIDSDIVKQYNINATSIKRLLSRDSISRAVSDIFAGYIDAVKGGDMEYHIATSDIIRLIKDNESAVRNEFGYEFSDEDYDWLNDYLVNEISLDDYSVGALIESAGLPASFPSFALSVLPLISIAIMCAAIIFGVFTINRKTIRRAYLMVGLAICASGFVFIVAWFILPGLINQPVLSNILSTPPVDVLSGVLYAGAALFAVGILSIIAYILMRISQKTPRT